MSKTAPRTTDRTTIPDQVATSILCRCRRRCCMCFYLDNDLEEKNGQLAHIDRDPRNSLEDNLVYLCLEHHNLYDTTFPQTKRYLPTEIKHYQRLLHAELAAKVEWELVIRGHVKDVSETQLSSLLKTLRALASGLEITLKDISEGSVVVKLESSRDAFEAIRTAFRNGTLAAESTLPISEVRSAGTEKVESLLRLSNELIESAEIHEAIACVNRAIEEQPHNPEAWALKATVLVEFCKRYEDSDAASHVLLTAYACSAKAVRILPDNATLLAHHAGVLLMRGHHPEAFECATRAVTLDANNGLAWYNIGVVHFKEHRLHDAIQAFETALRLGYKRAGDALTAAHRQTRRP